MKKKIIIIIAAVIVVLCGALCLFGRALPSSAKITEVRNSICSLDMDEKLFYRQTLNNCGPYSVMAVLNILKKESLDPEQLALEMNWRIYKNLTLPQGVVALLHKYKVSTKEAILKNRSDEEKIVWLENRIEEGKPVILLIKIHHVLHYVTVLGYDEKGFMLYDSMQEKSEENKRMTIVDEECIAGNRYYSREELINLWNAGGYRIFFRNWAVVCSNKV